MSACPVNEVHVNVRSSDTSQAGRAPPPIAGDKGDSSKGSGISSNSELAQALSLLQQTMDIDNDKDNDDYEDTLKLLEAALTSEIEHNIEATKCLQKEMKDAVGRMKDNPMAYVPSLCDKDGNLSKEKVDAFMENQYKKLPEKIKEATERLNAEFKEAFESASNEPTTTCSQSTPPPSSTEDDDRAFSTSGGTASYVAGAKVMSDLAASEGFIEYALNDSMMQETKRNADQSQIMIESAGNAIDDAVKAEEKYEHDLRRAKRKAHQNAILGHCISAVALVACAVLCPEALPLVVAMVVDQEQASIRSETSGKECKTGMDYATSGVGKMFAGIPGCSPATQKLLGDIVVTVVICAATAGVAGASVGAEAAAEEGAAAAATEGSATAATQGSVTLAKTGMMAAAMISWTKSFDDGADVYIETHHIDPNSEYASQIKMGFAIAGIATSIAVGGLSAKAGGAALAESMQASGWGLSEGVLTGLLLGSMVTEVALNSYSAALSFETGDIYARMAREQENISILTASLGQINSAVDSLSKDTDQSISTYSAQITQIGDSTNGIIQAAADYAFGSVIQA